eukprot:gnl/TRDRNA2_/TRDRNA2_189418_c0_seq1.p1 gnl/TRDRNA2_/TRDRNA2_189418_c0~~gnl/TRDRNA2_/TRDRNA2_189418_c0_seq1.p1  ORF type:complete len:402 (-),score=79.40 gnl/TRDRNA2_/TRDRNA2_189418_c0_seq1:236-1441(-)
MPGTRGAAASAAEMAAETAHAMVRALSVAKTPAPEPFKFPVIPKGAKTTIIPVAFPVTSAPTPKASIYIEEAEVLLMFAVAGMVWMLPRIFLTNKMCCGCFRRCLSRSLRCYFFVGLVLNVCLISFIFAFVPHVKANDIFYAAVHLIEKVTDQLEQVLQQLAVLVGVFMLYTFRKKIVALLGFQQQMFRADLRDVLTCFTMYRFRIIEVSLFKVQGLQGGFGPRTLFVRMILGYNEPQHTRPHDNVQNDFVVRERVQLNYDPEDDTQKFAIVVKQQEVVGDAISQMAPAAGAVAGLLAGQFTPIGPVPGAIGGAVTGIGAANSLGKEVGRVELSAAQINRLRQSTSGAGKARPISTHMSTGTPWTDDNYTKVDLVPQGSLWLRIEDLQGDSEEPGSGCCTM